LGESVVFVGEGKEGAAAAASRRGRSDGGEELPPSPRKKSPSRIPENSKTPPVIRRETPLEKVPFLVHPWKGHVPSRKRTSAKGKRIL